MDPDVESGRRYLHDRIAAVIGPRAAKILMTNLPVVDWSQIPTKADIDARLAQHTMIIVGANIATLLSLAGIALAVAQVLR